MKNKRGASAQQGLDNVMKQLKSQMNPLTATTLVAVIITTAHLLVIANPALSQHAPNQPTKLEVTPEMAKSTIRQRCSNCHAIEAGTKRFAPPLVGLIGRKAGSYEGFAYTKKIKDLNFNWTAEALNDWLAGTTFKTPDIRKRHVGIEQPELRKAVVEYITTLK
ncbi:MAG: c-type cytochrome [Hyphomicrobiaceae bacterium]